MYVQSALAREVSWRVFWRALVFTIAPPDRAVHKKLTVKLGRHAVLLNTETALSLLFHAVPNREPGMLVAVDSTIAKSSVRVVKKCGFSVVIFKGEHELVQVLSQNKVSILYLSDSFNQGGRKTHRTLQEFSGLVVASQNRLQFRPLQGTRTDITLWRPKGFTRSSGGAVLAFLSDSSADIERTIKAKQAGFERLLRREFLQDIAWGLFGYVQNARHVSKKPPLASLQLINERLAMGGMAGYL